MPGAARIRLFAEMLRRRSAIAGLPQRPDIEIIDMVTDMAAVPAETRSGSARAVFLKRAGRDPQIMRRLFGAEEGRPLQRTRRSEEHTSELQSLMRISYAVFCLNKKKTSTTS